MTCTMQAYSPSRTLAQHLKKNCKENPMFTPKYGRDIVPLLSAAMTVVLSHVDLPRHERKIFQQLRSFWKEGELCDIEVKGRDSVASHRCHKAVLCAASADLKNMLVGPFLEADQVQRGQAVEIAASDSVVVALLGFIYGEEPCVELEDAFELLRLADMYNLPELAQAIGTGLHLSLESAPVTTALKVLQQTQCLHELKETCEEKLAANFESCIELVEFLDLEVGQLARIMRREDLNVSREEVVLKGLLNWLSSSKDRSVFSGLLLQNIDFHALSSSNLDRVGRFFASMGRSGHGLQRDVENALALRKRRSVAIGVGDAADAFRPKRRCFQHWSAELGASQAPRKVLPFTYSLWWHDGAIYYTTIDSDGSSVYSWKPGECESQVVGAVNGANNLGCRVSVSPEGEIFVADLDKRRLLSFPSGNMRLGSDVYGLFCSPSGTLYVTTQSGRAVERLVGETRHPMMSMQQLPEELCFDAFALFVTKDEVIYITDDDNQRILRLKPGEAKPVVVGTAPNKNSGMHIPICLVGLFVSEEERIYVADSGQQKVWAFHVGDTGPWTEVVACPGELRPHSVLLRGNSLYVGMCSADGDGGVYEYLLPPQLQLDQ